MQTLLHNIKINTSIISLKTTINRTKTTNSHTISNFHRITLISNMNTLLISNNSQRLNSSFIRRVEHKVVKEAQIKDHNTQSDI